MNEVFIFKKMKNVAYLLLFKTYFVDGGSYFKMYFHRRPPDWKPLSLEENSKTNLEVQGPLGDEGTFQECRK